MRTTLLEGTRGPTLTGKPVYGGKNGSFKRVIHVSDAVKPDALYPILVGWDFGEEKPAVVFSQYLRHIGGFRILGAIKGAHIVLEDLVPKVLEIQARWFPNARTLPWCDPTGAKGNGGMLNTPVRLLQTCGVPARFTATANDAPVRYAAIQAVGGFMRRTAADGSPAFQMNPRCIELSWNDQGELVERETQLMVTAFMTGYVWGESVASDLHPNIRKPKKGTRYDDLMNALEYVVIGEGIISRPNAGTVANGQRQVSRTLADQAREELRRRQGWMTGEEKRALRLAQRDYEPGDPVTNRGTYGLQRRPTLTTVAWARLRRMTY